MDAFIMDINSIDWTPVTYACDIETKVLNFNSIILRAYDHHAPIKKIKIRHKPAPWITEDSKSAMAKRDKANRQYKKYSSDRTLAYYKMLRNRCNQLCRNARRRYIHDTIAKSDSQQIWRFLRTLGIGKTPISGDNCIDLNVLNSHFSNPPITLDAVTKSKTLACLSSLPLPQCTPFNFFPVSDEEVKKHILSISSTAVGCDNVCSRMIIPILPEILPILRHIYNFSLSSSSFPSVWKLAHVIPLPKTKDPTSPSGYRPISILPFLSKVLEHIVHMQLARYLRTNNLLNPYQSGFRPGHSTVTALVKVSDDIRAAMDKRQLTVIVFLDFSNAFNSIDFDVLLEMLRSLNISLSVIDWFNSYLRGRSQSIFHNESNSDWLDLIAGVPQGGVLSPLLFSIFINNITAVINSKFHLYADDLQLYHHFGVVDVAGAIALINEDLKAIHFWANAYGLLVNPIKSKAMLIGSRYMHNIIKNCDIPPIMYNGTQISLSPTVTI